MIFQLGCPTCLLVHEMQNAGGFPKDAPQLEKFADRCICGFIRGGHMPDHPHPHKQGPCKYFTDDFTPLHEEMRAIEAGLR